MLFAKLRQHGNIQRPAAQFHPQVLKEVGIHQLGEIHHRKSPYHASHLVPHTLCVTQYRLSREILGNLSLGSQFATVSSIVDVVAIRVPLMGDWSITAPR